MELTVHHETRYRYPEPVSESYTVVHLQPRTNIGQYCTGYELDVSPAAAVHRYLDRFGNDVQHFSLIPEHDELRIVATSHVVTLPRQTFVPSAVPRGRLVADPRYPDFYDFVHASPYVTLDGEVQALAQEAADGDDGDAAAAFLAIARFVHRAVAYRPGTTTVRTTIAEVIAARAGVCQDFAHLTIALARARGIPARYASGYIFRGVDPVLGADASHAWVEAYLPPFGWIGYDPTNDRFVDESFVLVALGRDYGDVSPTHGVYRGTGRGLLSVNVAIGLPGDQ